MVAMAIGDGEGNGTGDTEISYTKISHKWQVIVVLYEVGTVFNRAKLKQVTTFLEKVILKLLFWPCKATIWTQLTFHFWGPRAAAMYRVWTGSHLVWYQLLYHINLLYQHRNIFRPQGLANQELHNTRRPSVCTSWLNALSRLINMTPKLSQRWSRLSCRHPEPFSLSFGVKPLCPRVTVWYESWVIETYCPHFNEF